MKILQYPNPALRWRCMNIDLAKHPIREIVDEMFDLMYKSGGVGLAAPQVGLPFKLFVVNLTGDRAQHDQAQVFANARIVNNDYPLVELAEGCLSLRDGQGPIMLPVSRPARCVIEAQELNGEINEYELFGLEARVFQHEMDHFDGVLHIDKTLQTPYVQKILAQFNDAQGVVL